MTGSVELRLANDLDGLAGLADQVERFGAEHRLPANVVNAINVALDEAVSNAINHGYDAGVRGEIAVRLRRGADRVEVEVEDDGRPFDPNDAPVPAAPRSLEEAVPGGRGLMLVRAIAPRLRYERRDGRNRVTVAFPLEP